MNTKEECFERWQKAKPKRRTMALEIMSGKRDFDPNWPNWVVYDIRAEITKIEAKKATEAQAAEKARREKEARERAKMDYLL